VSQRCSEYPRRPDDDYATPRWVVQALTPFLKPFALHAWDPAAGAGSTVRALRAEGFRAAGTHGDFLAKAVPHNRVDAVVTNPPYGTGGRLACQFIEHALELVPVVAMLLRIDFDSAKTRTHLFRDCRAFERKIVLLDRIVWFEREGAPGPSENHCWAVCNKRHRGPPTISYVRRP
jgi:hypothetical protein